MREAAGYIAWGIIVIIFTVGMLTSIFVNPHEDEELYDG